uniref:Uncharacterized protein n=1 Tax=Ditylenchus dipsaci TaxID=166011 RepID=A0A915E1H4_9BILA
MKSAFKGAILEIGNYSETGSERMFHKFIEDIYPLFCHRLSGILLKITRPTLDNPPVKTSLLLLLLLKECPAIKLLVFYSDYRDQGLLYQSEIVDWLHQYSCPPVNRSINIFAAGTTDIALRNCTAVSVVEELKRIFELTTQRCHFRIAFEIVLESLQENNFEFTLTNIITAEQLVNIMYSSQNISEAIKMSSRRRMCLAEYFLRLLDIFNVTCQPNDIQVPPEYRLNLA